MSEIIIGQTKSVGFQFGLRKTIPVPSEVLWEFLLSPQATKIWLGSLTCVLEAGKEYRTREQFNGKVTVLKSNSHLRLTWKKPDWENWSTLQIRCIETGKNKSVLSFHQEKLLSSGQREEMKMHWNEVMKDMIIAVDKYVTKDS